MYIRVLAAAEYLGYSKSTMDKHRHYGTGPRYHKNGRAVSYTIADLDEWMASTGRTSTWAANDNQSAAKRAAA